MPLAESIQFTGPEVALIIGILLGIFAVSVSAVVVGFISAVRAGKGSKKAFTIFIVVTAIQGLALASALLSRSWVIAGIIGLLLGGQLAVFLEGSRGRQ